MLNPPAGSVRHMEETRSTLLVRLKDRTDQEAWQIFDQLYRPMLVGFACTRGLHQADAEDAAQQCIQSVLANIDRYEHVGSFKSWLRTIVENKIRDQRRRRRDQDAGSAVWDNVADDAPAPEAEWERHWMMEHLRYCVERVRPNIAESTYQAFYQNVIEGAPAKEVAQRLGITANQVYVAKFRVLERVRSLLTELTGYDLGESLA